PGPEPGVAGPRLRSEGETPELRRALRPARKERLRRGRPGPGRGALGRRRPHQISQRSARTMGSPLLQENAFANSGRFEGGPIARKRPRGCGFVLTIRRANSGRSLVAQIRAQERKKRWSAVRPSIGAGAGLPSRLFKKARWAIATPPRS